MGNMASGSDTGDRTAFGTAFRSGAFSAAEQLIAAYGARAYALARDIVALPDDEAAQDSAADAFRLLLEHRDVAPDDLDAVGAWWLQATRQAAIDRRRGRLQDPESIDQLIPEIVAPSREVRRFIADLPPDQSDLLTVIVVEGFTIAEAARRFSVPVPVVIQLLRDAMTTLTTRLLPLPPADAGSTSGSE
jgi:DNA-directed RNA polymerase specialized sigma24 family protein